jgi:hypothetical protein
MTDVRLEQDSKPGLALARDAEIHPEIERADALGPRELLRLANVFEDGRIRRDRGLRESWRVGFLDHLYPRRSDFEPQE